MMNIHLVEQFQQDSSEPFYYLYYLFLIRFLYPSQPEYKVADPICTFLFSVLVVGTTLPVTKDVCRILMEGKHNVSCL